MSGMTQQQQPRSMDQINSLHHFQQHSRLHFIGQWKTRMNDLFQTWFEERPDWNHGSLEHQSLFVHIDMDAFFCSVQLAKKLNEGLRQLPVGIAAGKHNSDISSCNYVARSYGVHAGMYVNSAKEICPNLVILGYDLPGCEEVAKTLYRVIFDSFPSSEARMSMEVYSIDEVMIATDTTDYALLEAFCERVRADLFRSTGCTASCGIGPNIMLARLATQRAKPDGVHTIMRDAVPEVMRVLPFQHIHGAGRSTVAKVQQLLSTRQLVGHKAMDDDDEDDANITCADVQKLSREELQAALGKKAGETFFNLCRGDDHRVAMRTGDTDDQKALGKTAPSSVGCSMNYAVRPSSIEDIWSIARQLVDEVCLKLKRGALVAHGLRVTVLERHPLHPKETQKYMGRGRCVEVHIPIKLMHALDENGASLMMDEIKKHLAPLLVTSRAISDTERADQLQLDGSLESHIIWTVTLGSLKDIVIEDVRGMTVQATSIRDKGEAPITRKRTRGQQMSLAAAFSSHVQPRKQTGSVTVVESQIDEDARPRSQAAPPYAGTESLFLLFAREWDDQVLHEWKSGCAAACNVMDLPLVKAYLRCALLKLAEVHAGGDPGEVRRQMDSLLSFVADSGITTPIAYL